jgi:hypothetical protein
LLRLTGVTRKRLQNGYLPGRWPFTSPLYGRTEVLYGRTAAAFGQTKALLGQTASGFDRAAIWFGRTGRRFGQMKFLPGQTVRSNDRRARAHGRAAAVLGRTKAWFTQTGWWSGHAPAPFRRTENQSRRAAARDARSPDGVAGHRMIFSRKKILQIGAC